MLTGHPSAGPGGGLGILATPLWLLLPVPLVVPWPPMLAWRSGDLAQALPFGIPGGWTRPRDSQLWAGLLAEGWGALGGVCHSALFSACARGLSSPEAFLCTPGQPQHSLQVLGAKARGCGLLGRLSPREGCSGTAQALADPHSEAAAASADCPCHWSTCARRMRLNPTAGNRDSSRGTAGRPVLI